jgi:hypothetical protein
LSHDYTALCRLIAALMDGAATLAIARNSFCPIDSIAACADPNPIFLAMVKSCLDLASVAFAIDTSAALSLGGKLMIFSWYVHPSEASPF